MSVRVYVFMYVYIRGSASPIYNASITVKLYSHILYFFLQLL
jgi:hypothetical protein